MGKKIPSRQATEVQKPNIFNYMAQTRNWLLSVSTSHTPGNQSANPLKKKKLCRSQFCFPLLPKESCRVSEEVRDQAEGNSPTGNWLNQGKSQGCLLVLSFSVLHIDRVYLTVTC